jgi:hypothetical protein
MMQDITNPTHLHTSARSYVSRCVQDTFGQLESHTLSHHVMWWWMDAACLTYMVVSASVVDAELSGMTIMLSEKLLKIHLMAMMLANRHEGRCFRGAKVARWEKKALWKTEGVAMIQA